eukprot:jgi/Ulvmu1/7298/UM035_0087.1
MHPIINQPICGHSTEEAALQVGMERYLRMAEAVHRRSDSEPALWHALRLAVEDRIRCRMRHMEDTTALEKQKEQLRLTSQSLEIAAERNQQLERQFSDLQGAMQDLKISAEHDMYCVREQLEQAEARMKVTNADLSSRVDNLKHELSNSECFILKLKDREHKLSLQLSQAEHSKIELNQALAEAQAESRALQAELRDNLQRWEQECAERLEAQAALQQTQANLVQASSAVKAADDRAHTSERQRLAAVQHLSLLSERKGSLLALQVALVSCVDGVSSNCGHAQTFSNLLQCDAILHRLYNMQKAATRDQGAGIVKHEAKARKHSITHCRSPQCADLNRQKGRTAAAMPVQQGRSTHTNNLRNEQAALADMGCPGESANHFPCC